MNAKNIVLSVFWFLMGAILTASLIGYKQQVRVAVTPTVTETQVSAPAPTVVPTQKPILPAPKGEEWYKAAYDDFGSEIWLREINHRDTFGCQFIYQASCGGKKLEVYLTTAPAEADYWLNCWDLTTKKPLMSFPLKIGSNIVDIPSNSRISFGTMPNIP